MYSVKDNDLMIIGFSHSEISGLKLIYQLTEAYRRLSRPSSPSNAKASVVCTYSLDHITPKYLSYMVLIHQEVTNCDKSQSVNSIFIFQREKLISQ